MNLISDYQILSKKEVILLSTDNITIESPGWINVILVQGSTIVCWKVHSNIAQYHFYIQIIELLYYLNGMVATCFLLKAYFVPSGSMS